MSNDAIKALEALRDAAPFDEHEEWVKRAIAALRAEQPQACACGGVLDDPTVSHGTLSCIEQPAPAVYCRCLDEEPAPPDPSCPFHGEHQPSPKVEVPPMPDAVASALLLSAALAERCKRAEAKIDEFRAVAVVANDAVTVANRDANVAERERDEARAQLAEAQATLEALKAQEPIARIADVHGAGGFFDWVAEGDDEASVIGTLLYAAPVWRAK